MEQDKRSGEKRFQLNRYKPSRLFENEEELVEYMIAERIPVQLGDISEMWERLVETDDRDRIKQLHENSNDPELLAMTSIWFFEYNLDEADLFSENGQIRKKKFYERSSVAYRILAEILPESDVFGSRQYEILRYINLLSDHFRSMVEEARISPDEEFELEKFLTKYFSLNKEDKIKCIQSREEWWQTYRKSLGLLEDGHSPGQKELEKIMSTKEVLSSTPFRRHGF